ncbi:hypothetical protein BC830DRAFT_1176025 [Chytriomyces sp. MP71]|nr:hypothetical protein BC830DRAFT_1176025 [Chytriomyces sp. MP71]
MTAAPAPIANTPTAAVSTQAKIKILLLEGPSQTGVAIFKENGFEVEYFAKALPEDQLKQKIRDVHAVGLR